MAAADEFRQEAMIAWEKSEHSNVLSDKERQLMARDMWWKDKQKKELEDKYERMRIELMRREDDIGQLKVDLNELDSELRAKDEVEKLRRRVVVEGMRGEMENMRSEAEWRESALKAHIKQLVQLVKKQRTQMLAPGSVMPAWGEINLSELEAQLGALAKDPKLKIGGRGSLGVHKVRDMRMPYFYVCSFCERV